MRSRHQNWSLEYYRKVLTSSVPLLKGGSLRILLSDLKQEKRSLGRKIGKGKKLTSERSSAQGGSLGKQNENNMDQADSTMEKVLITMAIHGPER